MSHALIIDDNLSVRCGVMDQLAGHGFTSFDHAWTERQALAAALRQCPDLIVIGQAIAEGSPFEVAAHIAQARAIPILTVTSTSFRMYRPAAKRQSCARQYCSSEMSEVVALCRGNSTGNVARLSELAG